MQTSGGSAVKTFTIGLRGDPHDEAPHARRIARHLGTDHTELAVDVADALEIVPRLPAMYDEPFADSSQIPAHLVSRLARRDVTVCLSGDGGDELFGGYTHYARARAVWKTIGWLPAPLRQLAARTLGALPQHERLAKAARLLRAGSPARVHQELSSRWSASHAIDHGDDDAPPPFRDPTEAMMYLDLRTYLPDDILVKVDRASMAVGLEVREPLLDHRLIAFAWSLPPSMKVRGREGKWLLRKLLHRYVPEPLVRRPKHGFSIPLGAWLRGPLRAWAEELLDARSLTRHAVVDAKDVRAKWDEHLSGARDWSVHLWDVLMLEAWLRALS
jgi:asparagine synthase (glutamine-hydrolysing)